MKTPEDAKSVPSVLGWITSAVENCFWSLKIIITQPWSLGQSATPDSQEAVIFVTVSAFIINLCYTISRSHIPAVVSWTTSSGTVFVATRQEWSHELPGEMAFDCSSLALIGICLVVVAL